MNPDVITNYDMGYVVLSYVMAIIGSFLALTAARKIRQRNGKLSMVNLGTASIALGGIGVWAMHFIGMLALNMDLAVGYSLIETLISLIAAVVATGLALAYVAYQPDSMGRIAGAGALLGCGVALMHYLGMYGMRFGGYIEWSYDLVGSSLFIAIAAATAALWLAFNTSGVWMRAAAALVMGIAVCAMHYTGMSAADFICTTDNRNVFPRGPGVISAFDLPHLVTVVALGFSIVLAIDQIMQRLLTPRH